MGLGKRLRRDFFAASSTSSTRLPEEDLLERVPPRGKRRTPSRRTYPAREKKKIPSTFFHPTRLTPVIRFPLFGFPEPWLCDRNIETAHRPPFLLLRTRQRRKKRRVFLLLWIPRTRCRHPSSRGFSIPRTWINRSLIGTHILQETREIVILLSLDTLAETYC